MKHLVDLPGREAIIDFLRQCSKPCTRRQIADQFSLAERAERLALDRRLRAMVRDGQLVKNRRKKYCLIDKLDLIHGRVMAHPDGYGFLLPDEGGSDLFLSNREMRAVLHGDQVIVRQISIDQRGKREGTVVEVLKRANSRITGRFHREKQVNFVVPDNKRLHLDILIPEDDCLQAKHGEFVVASIEKQPDQHVPPVGRITEVIGAEMNTDMIIDIALRAYELPHIWGEAVCREKDKIEPDIDPLEYTRREDLRALAFVTIDGSDAKDFDDAVYCEQHEKGWRLFVAIADVAHYVRPDSALDTEAQLRGTSIYLPQRVIPMLPEILSNELCSLKPECERLSLVCILDIGPQGNVKKYRFAKAVIRSCARLSYEQMVTLSISRDQALRQRYSEILEPLDRLYRLYKLLRHYRAGQALIEFGSVETCFEFDEKKQVVNIAPIERNDAHRMIEEFMLSANVAAGQFLQANKIPTLYRIHDKPKPEKLNEVREFLKRLSLGLGLAGDMQANTGDYASLLEKIKGRDDAHLIEMILLKSMPLAVYSAENSGHFGLGFDVYAHFTSPIRRYPDLLVHRAIHYLLERVDGQGFIYSEADMVNMAEHCTITERRAEEASRDTIQRMKCMYIQRHIGEVFPGRINSVTSFGLFVELDRLYVDGLIHISTLPEDYYHHDEISHRLYGERCGRRFSLGDRISIRVVRVNPDERKIDFELAEKRGSRRRKT